jgi:anti-sigma-K factor RskA
MSNDIREAIQEYLLAHGALDEEVVKLMQQACPDCMQAFNEAEAEMAMLALSVPSVAPPPDIKQRLMRQIRAGSAGNARPLSMPVRRRLPLPALIAAGLAVALFGVLAREKSSERKRDAHVAGLQKRIDHLEDARRAHAQLAPKLELAGTDLQKSANAAIAWDPAANTWRMRASGLAPLPDNKVYELWFITKDDRKIPAGTFSAGADGRGDLTVHLPPDGGDIALAAITDEPAGGSLQPTGKIQLVGKLD